MGQLIDKVSGRKGDRDSEEDEEETNQPVDLSKVTDMSNAARANAKNSACYYGVMNGFTSSVRGQEIMDQGAPL